MQELEHKSMCSKMVSQYDIPIHLVSDNGTRVASQEFTTFMTELDIKHIRTVAYYQNLNGQTETDAQALKHGLEVNYNKKQLYTKDCLSFWLHMDQ